MSAHDFSFTTGTGQLLHLADFKGRPVLVVNTASECGYTPQYAGLQQLWQRYRGRGLVVVGIPSNDFGNQEPGSEKTIKEFCTTRYGVDFPMTAKQTVSGANAHPFYRWIVEQTGDAGAPRWNFHKYLIGPDGELVDMWPSRIEPMAPDIINAIEKLLATA